MHQALLFFFILVFSGLGAPGGWLSPLNKSLGSEAQAFGPVGALQQAFRPVEEAGRTQLEGWLHPVVSRRYFNQFEQVMARFHALSEAQTEVLYLINTLNPEGSFRFADNRNETESWALQKSSIVSEPLSRWVLRIPPQHMLIL